MKIMFVCRVTRTALVLCPGLVHILDMSTTSPVTIITVVRGQISDLDVVLNILVYDAERLFIELMQLTTVSFDMIE